MRDNPRTTIVSALLGVVLLGGVFAFTVLVPELDDDAEPASTESSKTVEPESEPLAPAVLPDELTGGLVAVDLGTLPAELAQQFGDIDALKEQEDSIAEGLARVFGVPGAFRVYASTDAAAPSLAQVTVLDKAPGLFTPDALPIDPAVIDVARAPSELIETDGATCSVNWGEAVPTGQPIPDTDPQAVRCQLGQDDRRTFELTSQGLSVEDSVALLQGLAGQA